ncbi:MAG: hypothetical protein ABIJ47_00555 [Candidatus Bathyarchaeota archaeon]
MVEKQELDIIELFIDELANRAPYRYAGEKPLAVLAALETATEAMRKNNLTLSQALTSPLLGKEIKRSYIRLAKRTGKLKNPESSWSNVVSSKKELVNILHTRKSIDEAFRTVSKERADRVLTKYYSKLET